MAAEKLHFYFITTSILSLGTAPVLLDNPRDVSKMIGQRAVLNCAFNCSHEIQWMTNFEEYRRRHLLVITVRTVLKEVNVTEVEADGQMCKQSFVIHEVTPEWHKISVQCVALPRDDDNVPVYSMFATVYVKGKFTNYWLVLHFKDKYNLCSYYSNHALIICFICKCAFIHGSNISFRHC